MAINTEQPKLELAKAAPVSVPDQKAQYSVFWSLTLFCSLVVTLLFVPVLLAFQSSVGEAVTFAAIADVVVSLLFLADSKLLRARVADADDRKILLPGRWQEVVSTVPLFLLAMPLPVPSWLSAALLLSHSARLPAVIRAFSWHEKKALLNKRIKFVVLLMGAMTFVHWVGCVYIALWPVQEANAVTRYITALYYTVTTLTTVGYGDITPQSNVTRVFAMFLMLMGAAGYGFLISQMSQYLVTRDLRKEDEKNRQEKLDSMFRHYLIPAQLRTQAMSYFMHASQRRANDEEHKLLDTFPKGLKDEIQVYMNIKPLSHVSLFAGCSTACLADASHRLEQVSVGPGETIVHAGETGDEMYILSFGRVLVHVGDKHITELKDGSCFGEMSLIRDEKRGASVTALSYCDLFKLERVQFQELLKRHADLRSSVDAIVNARLKKSA